MEGGFCREKCFAVVAPSLVSAEWLFAASDSAHLLFSHCSTTLSDMLEHLALELGVLILSNLQLKDLGSVAIVCSAWYQVVCNEMLWKGLQLKQFGGEKSDSITWRRNYTNTKSALNRFIADLDRRKFSPQQDSSISERNLFKEPLFLFWAAKRGYLVAVQNCIRIGGQ